MDLKEMGNVDPHEHWYYLSKYAFIYNTIKRINKSKVSRIIEVGAGSGFFSQELGRDLDADEVIQIDINYRSEELDRRNNILRFDACPHFAGDLYLMIDVLEHVSNPLEFLKHYVSEAQKGALFIMTVPAFQFMWSEHDIFLGHYKRYTLRELTSLAQDTGSQIEYGSYIFQLAFPIAFLQRKIVKRYANGSAMQEIPKILNSLMLLICRFESQFFRKQRFGLSVLVIGRA